MERIAFLDFPAHLEARLLRDGDAMSMAHSLEVRPVMLDHCGSRVCSFAPIVRPPSEKKIASRRNALLHARWVVLRPDRASEAYLYVPVLALDQWGLASHN